MRVEGLFRSAVDPRELEAGDVIFAQGDPGQEMYGIIEGSVELSVDGRTIATLGPDDVFGEIGLLEGVPRTATVTATTEGLLVVLDGRDFLELVGSGPSLSTRLLGLYRGGAVSD